MSICLSKTQFNSLALTFDINNAPCGQSQFHGRQRTLTRTMRRLLRWCSRYRNQFVHCFSPPPWSSPMNRSRKGAHELLNSTPTSLCCDTNLVPQVLSDIILVIPFWSSSAGMASPVLRCTQDLIMGLLTHTPSKRLGKKGKETTSKTNDPNQRRSYLLETY